MILTEVAADVKKLIFRRPKF